MGESIPLIPSLLNRPDVHPCSRFVSGRLPQGGANPKRRKFKLDGIKGFCADGIRRKFVPPRLGRVIEEDGLRHHIIIVEFLYNYRCQG
jgi:hypothetical protein